ncbi:MAG: decaprenyl-phosphate phosphoribosyltransferase [Ardenticatenaceae bacterium]|nr:decaprenyl-phosphate phosphoribosyltransferase [Ardenticatenaceae bacterium]
MNELKSGGWQAVGGRWQVAGGYVQQNVVGLLKTMRPRQWVKNGFVFAALLFDGKLRLTELASVERALIAFILFCLISSAVYIMNDLMDIESDRQHPRKRERPLASGRLHPQVARVGFVVFAIGSVGVSFWLDGLWQTQLSWILLAYLVAQVAYTFYFKHQVLLDVSFIAAGFVLRVAAGVAVIQVARFSPWLYVCTGLLALFMALGKRRHELVLLGKGAGSHRAILQEYTLDLIDRLMGIVTTGALVAYSLYTFMAEGLPSNHTMMLTIPFVLYGLFRWLYLIHVQQEGGAPEELVLRDRPLQLDLFLWLITVFGVLYL